jgi:hypothetical protein
MENKTVEPEAPTVIVEKSCKMHMDCLHQTPTTCNVDCEFYNPMQGVEPSTTSQVEGDHQLALAKSKLEKFDKSKEMIVLKDHVFLMQSISPKKIILKFKKKMKPGTLPEGTYCFLDKENNEVAELSQSFKKLNIFL